VPELGSGKNPKTYPCGFNGWKPRPPQDRRRQPTGGKAAVLPA